jgi:N-acetylneuraminic acid mutarotase
MACGSALGALALLALVFVLIGPAEVVADARVASVADAVCGAGALVSDTWRTCASLPTTRTGAAGAAVGDTIYVIGGGETFAVTGTVEAYDTASDTWAAVSEMPTARDGLAAAALDGQIYAVGGWTSVFISPTKVVEVYDPISDTWAAVQPLPAPVGDLAVVAVDGKIYAIGGSDGFNTVTDTVMAYDPVSDTWEARAPLPTARAGLAAVVVDGLIYTIGGTDGEAATAKLEVYDPDTDSWGVKADMPITRTELAAAVAGGKIYVVGGSNSGFFPSSSMATNQVYDPGTDTWRTVRPMLTARSGLVAAGVGSRVYAIGGSVEFISATPVNEVYLPGVPFRIPIPLVLRSVEG